jgi:hypothetical protein
MDSRSIVVAVLFSVLLFPFGPGAVCAKGKGSNDRFNEEVRKNAKSVVKVVRDEIKKLNRPNSITNTIKKFKRDVDDWIDHETYTVTSYVDFADLERIDKDTSVLKAIDPRVDSLLSKKRLDLIHKVGDPTVLTGAEELRKLQRASDVRGAEISQLEDSRHNLQLLRDGYEDTEKTARAISDKLGDKVGNAAIEIYCLYNGRNFGLSWFDLSEEMVPALQDRVTAADAALKALDASISFAKRDLKEFDTVRNFVAQIYERPGSTAGPTNIGDINKEMVSASKEAKRIADEYRRQADEIRAANARIAGIQRLLGLGKSLADLTGATHGKAPSSGSSTSYSFKYNVIVMPPPGKHTPPVIVPPRR